MAGESQQPPERQPDPTVLTTEAITREVLHLEVKLRGKLDALLALLAERNIRYGERFDAQQLAVRAAFDAAEQAIQVKFESSEKAILKAEVSIEKRSDATYVSLQELSRSLSMLMPRQEAEARIAAVAETLASVALHVERIESTKVGGNEQRNAVYAFSGFIVSLLVIGGTLLAARPG